MNTNMIIAKLNSKQKGSWFRVSWISDVPITAQAKRNGHTVLKFTKGTMRFGISYSNLKNVRDKVENGTKELKHELSWGQWKPGYSGILIEHKGQDYVRLYTSPNKFHSDYFLDGKPIDVEELKKLGIVQNSVWNKSDNPPDCLTIKCGNIQEIW